MHAIYRQKIPTENEVMYSYFIQSHNLTAKLPYVLQRTCTYEYSNYKKNVNRRIVVPGSSTPSGSS